MNKKPIFNLNDESDDDDDINDSINILLSSENVKINYYQLLKWSKLVRDQYPKDEINRLSKDIQIFSQKYDIKDKSIKSFFQYISNEQICVKKKQYIDHRLLSKIFKVPKFERILRKYLYNDIDINFLISLLKDKKFEIEEEDDLLNEITIELEEVMRHSDINKCLTNQEFGDIPITRIHRIIYKNNFQDDLLYNFIKDSLDSRYILLLHLNLQKMSDESFFDLCDILLNNDESLKKRYFEFVRIELNHLKILKNQLDEIKKENNKLKIKKDDYKSKYKQLLIENENLKNENFYLMLDNKKSLKDKTVMANENKQIQSNNNNLMNLINKLKNDIENLSIENKQLMNNNMRLIKANEQLKKNADLLNRIDNEKVKNLNKTNLKSEIKNLAKDKIKLEIANEQLQEEKMNICRGIKNDKNNLEKENKKLKETNKKLINAIEQLKTDKKLQTEKLILAPNENQIDCINKHNVNKHKNNKDKYKKITKSKQRSHKVIHKKFDKINEFLHESNLKNFDLFEELINEETEEEINIFEEEEETNINMEADQKTNIFEEEETSIFVEEEEEDEIYNENILKKSPWSKISENIKKQKQYDDSEESSHKSIKFCKSHKILPFIQKQPKENDDFVEFDEFYDSRSFTNKIKKKLNH